MKKTLITILSIFPALVIGKTFTKEDISNANKYLIYENLELGGTLPEIIGLHCLSAKAHSKPLLDNYPKLKEQAFAIQGVNKNICQMAMDGLLLDNMEKYISEVEAELESKVSDKSEKNSEQ
ncbi:hypothetical protein BKK52_07840 [Rodentibacter trehalosifermentans]|uniref:Uncharacterized protein n=1 Tax=Rodentibacter trehalosifermentans TaxID=1908263 RepID=A0A1V3IZI3_9PAST|nr:hypothetical protein [Rodentibacter trehalosifermentans]OOF47820.1 hypothetical protein BKK52_07840 [Rodentibacter trehalosifermentans]